MTRIKLLVACWTLAAAAFAAAEDGRTVVIVGDKGDKATITLDGTRLTVTAQDGDNVSVSEVDLSAVAAVVGDALEGAVSGIQAALDELADRDVEVSVDTEHQVVVQVDGKTTTFDLDEVMTAVAGAVDELGEEMDGASKDDEELQQEIDALRAEITRLRAELAKVESTHAK